MKRLLVAGAAGALIGAAPPPLTSAEVEKLIDVKPDAPGCAVAIVQDGKVVLAQGSGLADLETKRAITPDTPFNIASMTKQFTGMAIALLIADGRISEKDDVRNYLPELRDYGAPIRIENLLNHSSGLRNHMALAAFQPGDHLPGHEEALRLVYRQSALNFVPGTRHQYESPNYVLLAEIVSRASGRRYEDFLAKRIFKPLGMTATGFEPPTLARAYAPAGDGSWRLQERVNRARGSSGLLSTVADFGKWMADYDRRQIGGRAAFERLLSTSHLADGSPVTYRYGLVKEFDYARIRGLTRISHGGQTAAYRSAFSYFPGHGFGSVVMCNHVTDARSREQSITDAWVKRTFPAAAVAAAAPASPSPAALPAEFGRQLSGTYYSAEDDDVRSFVVGNGQLKLRAFGQEFPLTHLGDGLFAFFDQGELRFEIGKDGAVSMVESVAGQARLQFAKLPGFAPQAPSEFTGRYRSADVDGEVMIEPKGDKLLLRYPAGEALLTAIGRDHFSAQELDFNSVRFKCDPSGRVAALTLSVSSGITRLRFRRVAE